MSGGAMVWLTDGDLERLIEWYGAVQYRGIVGHRNEPNDGDDFLREKLEAVREEVACKASGAGRTLGRDA